MVPRRGSFRPRLPGVGDSGAETSGGRVRADGWMAVGGAALAAASHDARLIGIDFCTLANSTPVSCNLIPSVVHDY